MKYLSIDYGLKRIGLAVSEGQLSSPWKVISISSLKDAVNQVNSIVKKENFDIVVIGLPEGAMGGYVRKFVKEMARVGVEIEFADETLSTKEAQETMIESGVSKRSRSANDAYAASNILQAFLDQEKL